MKNLLLLLFLLLFFTSLNAQQKAYSITGTLITEESTLPLESATVYLESQKDSTLLTYTISAKNGNFKLEGKTYEEKVILYVSYVGYTEYKEELTLNKNEINLGRITLQNANELDEIIIKSRAPITIKKDTLEFNVSSFNVKKDATVEDLLKELPGIEIDAEGKILVNGKPVNKLLVNGKPFFGDDPTIATRNLTKEMIEKVQVMDTKTDAEAFTGEEGDKNNKTINLTISEDKSKGSFGRLSAGGGTDRRFEYAGIFNRFDNDRRISFLGGGNNINSPGFSFGEIQKMYGGGRSVMMSSTGAFNIDGMSFGFGSGILNSRSAGASYADAYGKKADLSVDYFFSGVNSHNEEKIERENIYPDTRFFTNTLSISKGERDNHMVNLKFDIKIDSTFLINIKPSFNYSKSSMLQNKDETTFNQSEITTNTSDYSNFAESVSKTFKNNIDITKKFGNRGASLKLEINNEWEVSDTENQLNSETYFFDQTTEDEIRNQYAYKNQTTSKIASNIQYNYPLRANEIFWNTGYKFDFNTKESTKNTFDFNEETQQFDSFNEILSSDFSFNDTRYKPWTGLSLRKENWSFKIEAGYAAIDLSSKDQLRPLLNTDKIYKGIEYSSNFNYRFQNNSSLYFSGRFNFESPDINQLQPFEDVSNPLHIITGNPDLKPIQKHAFYGGYNKFNFQAGTGFNFYGNFILSNADVVSKTTIDENFIRRTTYTNVDGNYWFYTGASYSKSVKLDSIHTLKIATGVNVSGNKRVSFNNEEQFSVTTNATRPNFGFTYTWKDVLEINPKYSLGYTQNRFDIQSIDNQEFFSHNLQLITATFFPKNLEWRNDINFVYNPDVASGFEKNAIFWNSTLAYSVLKNQGTITFKVYDLLKQNVNTSRSANQNYIQDAQSRVLQQYFMLSFSWKFNNLGSKGETRDGSIFMF